MDIEEFTENSVVSQPSKARQMSNVYLASWYNFSLYLSFCDVLLCSAGERQAQDLKGAARTQKCLREEY